MRPQTQQRGFQSRAFILQRERAVDASEVIPNKQKWAEDYHAWPLVNSAMMQVGKQAGILIFLFYQICEWNNTNHLLLMSCKRDTHGWLVYPCEATKAFTRCFPLYAASVAMLMTGRYILQNRIYYKLLLKKVLLDFTNYDMFRDRMMLAVLLAFVCSLLHFVLVALVGGFEPPYMSLDKVIIIATVYLTPCGIFFLLMFSAANVERFMTPLPKFVEEHPPWAKKWIAESICVSDSTINRNTGKAVRKLYREQRDHRFEIGDLIDEIIDLSYHNQLEGEQDWQAKQGIHGFLEGMWPARILLNPYDQDPKSNKFRRAFLAFTALVAVIQCGIVIALGSSAVAEAIDARPGGIPTHDAFYVGKVAFEMIGVKGYCRDKDYERPPEYGIALDDLHKQQLLAKKAQLTRTWLRPYDSESSNQGPLREPAATSQPGPAKQPGPARGSQKQAVLAPIDDSELSWSEKGKMLCATHCADNVKCIGFAVDMDHFCRIYLSEASGTPYEGFPVEQGGVEYKSGHWQIVMTDSSVSADCWAKLEYEGQPQKYVSCLIYAVTIIVILCLVSSATYHTFLYFFVSVDDL
jgi:hypothetical protein